MMWVGFLSFFFIFFQINGGNIEINILYKVIQGIKAYKFDFHFFFSQLDAKVPDYRAVLVRQSIQTRLAE